jgi:hypothetical protein
MVMTSLLGFDIGGASLPLALLPRPASPGEPEVPIDALALAIVAIPDSELVDQPGLRSRAWH